MSKSNKTFTEKATTEFSKRWNRSWNSPNIKSRKRPKRKLPQKTTEGFQ